MKCHPNQPQGASPGSDTTLIRSTGANAHRLTNAATQSERQGASRRFPQTTPSTDSPTDRVARITGRSPSLSRGMRMEAHAKARCRKGFEHARFLAPQRLSVGSFQVAEVARLEVRT